ncbi:MAG: tRNA (guanosine(37)-N1)-methyltransferase TrmD [Spirochaetes bacterium]|nr:tRNA (guanosine(37)-N1)-methyltransferase TrmD [Spirochaetota bacterium]
MKITVLTLFPEILRGFFENSIMKRAVERGLVSYELVDVRNHALDKHRKCDDEVYGGGPGMLMLTEPLGRALDAAGSRSKRTVYLTPGGRLFNQDYARDLAREPELVLICGRYEGIDQRVIDKYVDDEITIGDYVISSGEVAALVLTDAIYRLIDGVITGESLEDESFEGGLLEYPQYTRPAVYDTLRVPDVLSSGHHANIARWRLRKRVEKTLAYRPELLSGDVLTDEIRRLINMIISEGGSDEPD